MHQELISIINQLCILYSLTICTMLGWFLACACLLTYSVVRYICLPDLDADFIFQYLTFYLCSYLVSLKLCRYANLTWLNLFCKLQFQWVKFSTIKLSIWESSKMNKISNPSTNDSTAPQSLANKIEDPKNKVVLLPASYFI